MQGSTSYDIAYDDAEEERGVVVKHVRLIKAVPIETAKKNDDDAAE